MRKSFFTILLSSFLLVSLANAKDGVYVGGDLVLSNTKYKYHDKIGYNDVGGHSNKARGNGIGGGVSVGYNKSFNQIFIAPEIFYDYLNSSAKDYYRLTPPYQQDTIELRSRYGVKANFGYDINKSFSAYLTYGLANVQYVNRYPSLNRSQGKSELSPIYGIGSLFHINNDWSFKAELNQQRFNIRNIQGDGAISKSRLNVLKVGLVYNF